MFFLKLNRKKLKTIFIFVLVFSFGFGIYSFTQNKKLAVSYESIFCNSDQLYKSELIGFLTQETSVPKDVEIFDINEGKVIKKIKSNPSIQKEAGNFLKGITGMYAKVKAIPDKGYIARVPLRPPVMIKNQWLNDLVKEVFVIFPENEKPYLLILDDKLRPLFYNFKGNTDEFLKILDIPQASQ